MIKLIMIGALGNMLGPASKHLVNFPGAKVLRVLDRGTAGLDRDNYRLAWREQGTKLVNSMDALIADNDFDGVVICAGKNGDDFLLFQQIVPKLKANTFILHLSTVSCNFVTATEKFCHQHQIDYVNYPLTGGALGAANANMLILAGGPSKTFHQLEPMLKILGNPRYLGVACDSGAVTKLIGHVLVFTGLITISSAVTLQARSQNKLDFFAEQVELFDFLNQGAGGTRQWDVALKNGVKDQAWHKGFLLKHAAVDLIYLLQLMLEKNQFTTPRHPLFELAYSFAYLLQQDLENYATQVIAQYWLIPEKAQGLQQFLSKHFDPAMEDKLKLEHCVSLFPEHLQKTVMLAVEYK